MKKAILLIIDGLGDLPTPKTPLQAAKIPNLNRLAKKGITGMLSPLKRYLIPGSDTSHLAILGYDPAVFYCGRGPFEALGLGIRLNEGDVAFRANFATLNGNKVTDRRAGRIETQVAASLVKYLPKKIDDVEIIFKNSVEHRGALVLRGRGLSSNVSQTDPHGSDLLEDCQPMDNSPEARKTADIINKFTVLAIDALSRAPENQKRDKKANVILLRGAGDYTCAPSFYERFGILGACIAGGALYRGVASFMGMDIIMVPGATGDKNTNLKSKADAAVKAIQNYDFLLLHIKMCDSFSHDGDFEGKKKSLEKIDRIIPILEKSGAHLVITGDHSTPCSLKAHSGHEIPILVSGGERYDSVSKFNEIDCAKGGLGHIKGKDIVPLILNITGHAEKYGS
ncbi:2,3-bisphosphoglycerate-independent phosphoglycerate mutase 1 [Candidatus Bilamarchaeum dharawalense]|uniref:2,3-bisphosphoglycerate-independent phosphoglycerate mutase n=1 Tax=Candidatus Bilamarchaeum dharawalense TaxID=2885759 RepID=A0A5E4LRL1_9ARCH|nr:2,3-bisphosphoglycerate-independent phosphoglycerate mutase 1 [Candidatus Bilamarchaeum dharawalense]